MEMGAADGERPNRKASRPHRHTATVHTKLGGTGRTSSTCPSRPATPPGAAPARRTAAGKDEAG